MEKMTASVDGENEWALHHARKKNSEQTMRYQKIGGEQIQVTLTANKS
jgi:hypothetical protein